MRTFFAAEIDEPLRQELDEVIAGLRRADAAVRWVAPENLHWTVKFLGDVPLEQTGAIAAAARQALAGRAAFAAPVRGVAPFPDGRRMRLVAASMEDGGRLGALRDALEAALEEFGVPRDGRGFRAHLTLGRVKGSRNLDRLAAALGPLADRDFGECRVEALTLFMSELARQGPTYTPLARLPLAAEEEEA